MPIKNRIVAEVTKNWPEATGSDPRSISQMFEEVIAFNKKRLYKLESWKMTAVGFPHYQGHTVETIVAVFVKENG